MKEGVRRKGGNGALRSPGTNVMKRDTIQGVPGSALLLRDGSEQGVRYLCFGRVNGRPGNNI